MPFCPNCGAQAHSEASLCSSYGLTLRTEVELEQTPKVLAYRISDGRVLAMTILSQGLYLYPNSLWR